MKIISLTVAFFCLVGILQAQVDLKWNEENTSAFTNYVVEEDAKFLYMLSSNKEGMYIEQFDKENLALVKQTAFQIPVKEAATLEYFSSYQGKLTLFYSVYFAEEKKLTLFAYQLDKDTKVLTPPKELFSKTLPKKFVYKNFKINISPEDSTYYFIYHIDAKSNSLDFIFVDNKLDILDIGNYDFANSKPEVGNEFVKCVSDKNFNIYIQTRARYQEEGTTGYFKSALTKITFNEEGKLEEKEKYNWVIANESVDDLLIYFDKGDEMIVAAIRKKGAVMEKKNVLEEARTLGLLITRINTLTGKKVNEEFSSFDKEQLKSFLTADEWKQVGTKSLLVDLIPVQIVPLKSGGYYLICEERQNIYFSGSNSGYNINFLSILTCKMSGDDRLSWLSYIPKRQGFVSNQDLEGEIEVHEESQMEISVGFLSISGFKDLRKYLSYTLLQKDEKLCFLFNDGLPNFKGKGEMNYVQFGFSYGVPAYAIVEKEGRASKHLFYDKLQKDLRMRTGISYKTSNGDYLIFSGKGDVNKLAKVTF